MLLKPFSPKAYINNKIPVIAMIAIGDKCNYWAQFSINSIRSIGNYTGKIFIFTDATEKYVDSKNLTPIKVKKQNLVYIKALKPRLFKYINYRRILYIDSDIIIGADINNFLLNNATLSDEENIKMFLDSGTRKEHYHTGIVLVDYLKSKKLMKKWVKKTFKYNCDQTAISHIHNDIHCSVFNSDLLTFPDHDFIKNRQRNLFVHFTLTCRVAMLGQENILDYCINFLKLPENFKYEHPHRYHFSHYLSKDIPLRQWINTGMKIIFRPLRLLKPEVRRFFYYNKIYRKIILFSKPIICNNHSDFEVHVLTSEKDFLDAFWCLKTFYHYSGQRPKLVIHEDGSLSAKGIEAFLKHFVNCRIIRLKDATEDLGDFLANYKYCQKYRLNKDFNCSLKLFDPFYYANTDKILLLDSDILFFREPDEMIEYIKDDKPFFNSDYRDSYTKPVSQLNKILGVDIFPRINAGLIFQLKKNYIDSLSFIEEYFKKAQDLIKPIHLNQHEQTLNALLLSKYNGIRLNGNYQISMQPITEKTISHHFVNDGSRNNFYKEGLRYLKLNKFLKEFNKASRMQCNKMKKMYIPPKEELELAKKANLYAGENHLGGYLIHNKEFPHGDPKTWFPELWKWIYDELGVRSVLDVGCGEGLSTKFFKDLGCEVLGVDGSIQAKKDSVIRECHNVHDFNNGPFVPSKTYDLVWSCEFVEHIEEKYIDNFLKTFSYANKYIMMTHAVPGQKGWHHVNCQAQEYWIKKLSQIGFIFEPLLTGVSRNLAGEGHFEKSGLIFVSPKFKG